MSQVQRTRDGLSLSGVVDVRCLADLREAIEAVVAVVPTDMARGRAQDLRLDVRRVAALDAATLALLVSTHRRLADRGGRLVLDGVEPSLARVLAVTRLNRVLHVRRGSLGLEGTAGTASPAA
jgi:anti-anti-sigma factor